jgi:hypothetical protein
VLRRAKLLRPDRLLLACGLLCAIHLQLSARLLHNGGRLPECELLLSATAEG